MLKKSRYDGGTRKSMKCNINCNFSLQEGDSFRLLYDEHFSFSDRFSLDFDHLGNIATREETMGKSALICISGKVSRQYYLL